MAKGIGERLKQLRKQQNLTQKELAELVKVSPSTIGMYEQDRRTPKMSHLVQLSKIFGASIDFILIGSGNKPADQEKLLQKIVERVEQKISVAEPAATLTAKGEALKNLSHSDLEYLCNALLSAVKEESENEEK